MTNNIDTIITEIERLLLLAGVKKTIRYPEQYKNIGNQYPLAIIKEGRLEDTLTSGSKYINTWSLSIVLITTKINERSKVLGDLEAAVFNQIFADNIMGGLVMNIDPVTTYTGSLNTGSDISAFAGFNEAAMSREINLVMTIIEDRYFAGSGTLADPYLVYNAKHLDAVRNDLTAHYLQKNNINIPSSMDQIGSKLLDKPFTGSYNGGGYSISGLDITTAGPEEGIGLFGYLASGAIIINLTLDTCAIDGDGYVGGIAGYADGATITNCHVSGQITSSGNDAGGIVGVCSNTNITSCSANVTIISNAIDTGGIAAGFSGGTMRLCSARVDIVVSLDCINAGGLTGYASTSIIDRCWADGEIAGTGSQYAGGASGYSDYSTFSNCYSTVNVNAASSIANAGFVAGALGDIIMINCYCANLISESILNNGFTADLDLATPTITSCYWDAELSGIAISAGTETGITTAEAKAEENYIDWNFTSTWLIDADYPDLRENSRD